MRLRGDPGPCLVCGAAHCSCVNDAGAVAIPQLPLRDAQAIGERTVVEVPPLVADLVQSELPEGVFTSGTYRRPKVAGK